MIGGHRIMKHNIIFFIFLFLNHFASAQHIFYDLEEALKKKSEVEILKLNLKDITNEDLKELDQFIHLHELEISECNRVTGIPESIISLKELKKITYNWNGTGMDHDWEKGFNTLSMVKSLQELYLGPYNYFGETLPSSIGRLTKLKILSLEMTVFKELPVEIGKLKELEILNLNMTRVNQLPKEILELKKLKKLYLIDTEISFDPLKRKEVEELFRGIGEVDIIYDPL